VPSASLRTKPVQTPTVSSKGSEPPIHAALKRSSALSVNDNTQICIDITGDQEGIKQEVSIGVSSEGTGNNAGVPARFASLAPFYMPVRNGFRILIPTYNSFWLLEPNSMRYTVSTFPVSMLPSTFCQKAPGSQRTSVFM